MHTSVAALLGWCAGLTLLAGSVHAQTVVKFLGIPMLGNQTLDQRSFQIAVDNLKRDNINLIVDLAPTLSTTDYAGLIGSLLKVNSSEYDIYMIDVVWPGQYADSFLDISSYIPASIKSQHIENIYNANNIGGRQVAVPFFADYGMMFYRADLLQKYNFTGPPRTWEEMETMMSVIVPAERRTNPSFFGYAGQYNAYEGLTCNMLEWVFSAGAGTIIEPNKTVSVNSPAAVEVIKRIRSWLVPPKTYTPLTGLIFDEASSYQLWLKGNLLFLRNWPFVYSITNNDPTFPKFRNGSAAFGMTRLPGTTPQNSAATLGGWQLAINRFTKNPEAAVKAVLALMTREFQLERYKLVGVMPTISSLYDGEHSPCTHAKLTAPFQDPEFCRLNTQCKVFGSLQVAARPAAGTAPFYLAASEQIYLTTNKILRDEMTVEDGLRQLTVSIQKAIRTYVEPSVDLGPPVFVDYTDPLGIAFMAVAATLAFCALVLFAIIVQYRNHKIMTSSSPVFMLIMVVGTLLAHAAIFVYTGEPTRALCIVQPWLLVMAYSLTVSALVTKNYRIFKIFRNKHLMKLKLQDTELIKACACLIAVNVVLLIVWTAVDPPQKVLVPLTTSQFYGCRSSNSSFGWGIIGGLLAYNSLLLGAGVYLAYYTRNVKGPYNESKFIGYTIYTMVLLNIILIPLSYIEMMGPKFQYLFRGVGIELSAVAVSLNMFVPKIAQLFREKDDNVSVESSAGRHRASSLSAGSQGQSATDAKTKNLRSAVMEVIDGLVYMRTGKTKFAMSLASWRDMNLVIIPSMTLISMYPAEARAEGGPDVGMSFQARSVVVEDIPNENDQYLFYAVLNGTHYQIQVVSADLKEKWMLALRNMYAGEGGTLKRKSTANPGTGGGTAV
ncbi:hypothetical protein HDU96_004710 [Phlyctochytrium bullatum]|nr:hypothetical protein HDU96_004710 [Phlyctochytrium bullatum]